MAARVYAYRESVFLGPRPRHAHRDLGAASGLLARGRRSIAVARTAPPPSAACNFAQIVPYEKRIHSGKIAANEVVRKPLQIKEY